MNEILVKYRTWHFGSPPRPIKLQIPGWSGHDRLRENGAIPQPWHCPPFVEGNTYGHELIYPFKNECKVKRIKNEIVFEGDFSSEPWMINSQGKTITGNEPTMKTPPMMTFAPTHYGMSSAIDLEPPEGYVLRTEPHPRFYTDDTGTVPCLICGHIQRWWSRIFFVVFKAPREGEVHIFRPGEPYGQVLFVPQKNNVSFQEFTDEEKAKRELRDSEIGANASKIATSSWKDHKGFTFDNKYKTLSSAYQQGGYEKVDETIRSKKQNAQKPIKTKIPKRLFKNETNNKKKQNIKKTLHTRRS